METEGEGVNQTLGVIDIRALTHTHTHTKSTVISRSGGVSMWGKTREKETHREKIKKEEDQKNVLFDLARVSK